MNKKIFTFVLVMAAFMLGAVVFRLPQGGEQAAKKETAFERVMRTRTLRCAYAVWLPYFMMDPNTKKMKGINYELMEAIGKAANLKIEWQEEIGYGVIPDQLRSGKQDVFCSGVRLSVARAQRVELSAPIAYMPVYAYVRDDDARFDGKLDSVNAEAVTISVVDGSTIESIAKTTFPKAKLYSLPEMSDMAQVLDAIAARKADVVFTEETNIVDYNKNNAAKKLRRVSGVAPVRTLPAVMAVAKGEWALRDLLNAALQEVRGDGTVDRILNKYDPDFREILRIAPPYIDRTK